MSLFGKKITTPMKPAAPASYVPAKPPVPPASNQPAASQGVGRKRITQRLVLGGKGAETGSIAAGGGAGLRLPGAPDPVTSQSIPMADYTGTVDIPVATLLPSIPVEFVVSDHDTIYQSPVAQESACIPLSLILPLLPSGKVEILAQDLFGYLPQGVMKTPEELGEYALSPVTLPLQEIIRRMPEGSLNLRTDQKPIDSSVTGMEDPFSAEMLAAAQEEAAQKAQEQAEAATQEEVAVDDADTQTPTASIPGVAVEAPAAESPETVPPEVEAVPDLSQAEEEAQPEISVPEPDPESAPTAEVPSALSAPQPAQESSAEGDWSFAQSPEYQAMLKQMEAEEKGQQAEAPQTKAAPESTPTTPPPASLSEDISDTEFTQIIPKVPDVLPEEQAPDSIEEEESADNPLFAPTRIMDKSAPPKEQAPPSFSFPDPPPAKAKEEPKPISGFKFQAPQPVAKKSPGTAAAPATAPVQDAPAFQGGDIYQVSGKLVSLLGIRSSDNPTLKDIVHQINSWPGMKGCIVGGKDGLRISSDVEDDNFANSISAFAPKLISTISDLFNDLGFDDVEEMHTPVRDSSVYIFRKQDLYMIVLFEETAFPESYRTRIKQVMEEIGSAN